MYLQTKQTHLFSLAKGFTSNHLHVSRLGGWLEEKKPKVRELGAHSSYDFM